MIGGRAFGPAMEGSWSEPTSARLNSGSLRFGQATRG